MRTINTEISNCGLIYNIHYNLSEVKVYGIDWGITIPIDELREFVAIFPELNWEDGEFIHNLKGKYIRLTYDENFEIYSISHIVKNLTYIVKRS